MKKGLLFVLMLLLPVFVFGQATELFFSEYIEGSSSNKAIEIFNGTGAQVDLSEYTIERYNNGGTSTSGTETLSGVLANGDVYVIANSGADQAILDVADITSTITYFNGDDFLVLTHNGVEIDVIGVKGEDPGSEWPVAGGAGTTANHTLVRKASVMSPTTDWATSAGTNVDDSQWIVYPQDTFDNLGSHSFAGGGSDLPPVITNLTTGIFENGQSNSVSATVTDDNGLTSVELFYYFIENDQMPAHGDTAMVAMAANGDTWSADVDMTSKTAGTGFVYWIVATDNATVPNVTTSSLYKGLLGTSPLSKLHVMGQNGLMYMDFMVRAQGVVTAGTGLFTGSRYSFYMQDATGGTNLYNNSAITTEYAEGDELLVTGSITEYRSLTELEFASVDDITVVNTGQDVTPVDITSSQIDEAHEGMLVRLTNVTPVSTLTWAGYSNFDMQDDDGPFTMRVATQELDGTPEPTWPADIIGILSAYNTPQVMPRHISDISTLPALDIRDESNNPSVFTLEQNYPNPFNPSTTIAFSVKKAGVVQFRVFNALAQEVFTSQVKAQTGSNTLEFDGSNLPSGLYFYQIQQGNLTLTKKMVLMK